MNSIVRKSLTILPLGILVLIAGCERPSPETVQRGYRGLGMVELYHPDNMVALQNANRLPEVSPKQDPTGQLASQVYQNVQVLKDVDAGEFIRLMTDLTNWVSPQQGCAYCHAEGEDLASDKLYTKVVARRMIEMTRRINGDWQKHVACLLQPPLFSIIEALDRVENAPRCFSQSAHIGLQSPGIAARMLLSAVRPAGVIRAKTQPRKSCSTQALFLRDMFLTTVI